MSDDAAKRTSQQRREMKHKYIKQNVLGIQPQSNFLQNHQGLFITSAFQSVSDLNAEAYRVLKMFTNAIPNALEQNTYKYEHLATNCRNCTFIFWPVIDSQDTPQQVRNTLLIKRTEGYEFKRMAKMWPVNYTCKAEQELILQYTKLVVIAIGDREMGLDFKIRNNSDVSKAKGQIVDEINAQCNGKLKQEYWFRGPMISIQICCCNAMIGWYEDKEGKQ